MSAPRFVRIFGYLFAVFCLGTLWLYYLTAHVPDLRSGTSYFIAANLVFYLVGSLGLLSRRLLGYYALKVFLYVLLLAFPIGTVIAVRILRYMKREKVRSVFR
jgi:hypothetical protein